MKKETKLKSCPFCGEEVKIYRFAESDCGDSALYSVGCVTDYCYGYVDTECGFETEAEAVKLWNIRSPKELDY